MRGLPDNSADGAEGKFPINIWSLVDFGSFFDKIFEECTVSSSV